MADNNFKMMDDREYMLHRPEIFIGSMQESEYNNIFNFKYQTKRYVPALVKIIEEIIDNSVDATIRSNFKEGLNIGVSIKNNGFGEWFVEVTDDASGIPVELHDGKYQAELCWTRPRAGSNFNDDGRVTIGRNGVGSACTNFFSKSFLGISGNGKECVTVETSENCLNITTTHSLCKSKGTTVVFYPDLKRFGVTDISQDIIDVIKDRLTNMAICYPKISFRFNDERIMIKNPTQLGKLFNDDAISIEDDNYNIVIAPSGDDEEFRHLSYFNGISIKNGGNHIDYFVTGLCAELIPMIKRKWKIDVLPNQIKQHLLIACWVRNFPNLKFDSQSKERVTNTNGEIKSFLNIDFVKLAKKVIVNETIINPAIESILRKKEAIEKRAATNALKKAEKKKIAGHIAANDKNPENKTLYITEGLSASGMGTNVRDPKYHGFYSLRGKVLNSSDMSFADILKNKELADLISIIGLDINSKSIHDEDGNLILNYGRISILTDADSDGVDIFCQLLNFFSYWPELFSEQRIVRVNTPLFICTKKNKPTKYFYTFDEYDVAKDNLSGYDTSYIKGLGSLEKTDYKETVIVNPQLVAVELDDLDMLKMIFGNDPDKRKEWLLNG